MKIKDCMCKDIEYISGSTSVKECAELMLNKHVGCMPICDENRKVIGLVTDRDIILRSIACNKNINLTPVSEIMTTNVYSCMENEQLENAEKIMSENQIRRLPITNEEGKIVGIISLANLCKNQANVGDTLKNICNQNNKNAE